MAKYKFTFLKAEISHASQGLAGKEMPPTRLLPPALQKELETQMKLTADWEKLCEELVKVAEFEADSLPLAYEYLKTQVEALAVNTGSEKVVLNGGSQPTYRPRPEGHWIEDWLQLKTKDAQTGKEKTMPWEIQFPQAKPEYKLYPILRVLLSPPK